MTNNEVLLEIIDFLESDKRSHYYCEDTYYSCPMHEEGCTDEFKERKCNCGADEKNAEIDNLINKIKLSINQ